MTLSAFVLAACGVLAPGRDVSTLAEAIAAVVAAERPLFADDDDRHKTAALLVAIGFRESSLDNAAVSKTNDYCAMQIHRSSGGSVALTRDPVACVRRGMELLRQSFRVCPDHPVAWYAAGGNAACTNERARRISNDRTWLARRVLRAVSS